MPKTLNNKSATIDHQITADKPASKAIINDDNGDLNMGCNSADSSSCNIKGSDEADEISIRFSRTSSSTININGRGGNDHIKVHADDPRIYGRTTTNTALTINVDAGPGDDTIVTSINHAGAVTATLHGGVGTDTFVLGKPTQSAKLGSRHYRIDDFTYGEKVDLRDWPEVTGMDNLKFNAASQIQMADGTVISGIARNPQNFIFAGSQSSNPGGGPDGDAIVKGVFGGLIGGVALLAGVALAYSYKNNPVTRRRLNAVGSAIVSCCSYVAQKIGRAGAEQQIDGGASEPVQNHVIDMPGTPANGGYVAVSLASPRPQTEGKEQASVQEGSSPAGRIAPTPPPRLNVEAVQALKLVQESSIPAAQAAPTPPPSPLKLVVNALQEKKDQNEPSALKRTRSVSFSEALLQQRNAQNSAAGSAHNRSLSF